MFLLTELGLQYSKVHPEPDEIPSPNRSPSPPRIRIQEPAVNQILYPEFRYYEDEGGPHRLEPGSYTVGVRRGLIFGVIINDRLWRVLDNQRRRVAESLALHIPFVRFAIPDYETIPFGERIEDIPDMSLRTAIIPEYDSY